MRLSVVIVTWQRAEHVRRCLERLSQLDPLPDETVIVDASADDATLSVVRQFPDVDYVRFPGGAERMTTSRNVGLLRVSGYVVAFLDDDAFVRPGWSNGVLDAFADRTVAAVAGRTCNGLPGEDVNGVDAIGRLLPTGQLTANFAADPRAIIEVEHGIGANMSFRRDVLAHLGGFRDDFRGVGGLREDTDMFLRVRALGHRAVFTPFAVVDHVGAPHAKGRRFDHRYGFWARHNHALLLSRNFGLASPALRSWLVGEIGRLPAEKGSSRLRSYVRVATAALGLGAGLVTSLRKARSHPIDPQRRDATGEELRRRLAENDRVTGERVHSAASRG
jgi:GT2 family glycosyltransferase